MNAPAHDLSTCLKDFRVSDDSFDESPVEVMTLDNLGYSTTSQLLRQAKEPGATDSEISSKEYKAVPKPRFFKADTSKFEWVDIIQTWEGRVISVNRIENEFSAIITDRTNRQNPEEEVILDLSAIKNSDQELVQEGAVFYWNVGKMRVNKAGTIKNASDIRMRRLPGLSRAQIDRAKALGERIAERLHAD